MNDPANPLDVLNGNLPLSEKLFFIHKTLRGRIAELDRVSVALYDAKADSVSTFIDSSGDDQPLVHYEAKLSEVPSLDKIRRHRRPRLVNDLTKFTKSTHEHTRKITHQGYQASYTIPMYAKDSFLGFIFFNSYQKDAFQPEAVNYLDVFGHLIALLISNELSVIRTLQASVQTASDLAHHRDMETGSHLDRMAHYSKLIATVLADAHALDDQYIEYLFLFAPLHDIGKIAIPDKILLKRGGLSETEFERMKYHVERGRKIIDDMLDHFGLSALPHVTILRNIVEYHHERLDGSGYLHHLQGDQIPLEARIVAVADVFDALTSRRPYKEAWDNRQAFDELQAMAGKGLDTECVGALLSQPERINEIQTRFQENYYG